MSDDDRTLLKYIKFKNVFLDFLNFIISDEIQTLKMIGIYKQGYAFLRKTEILHTSTISDNMNKIKVKPSYLINKYYEFP